MTDQETQETALNKTPSQYRKPGSKQGGSSLDRAWPPVWIMAITVGVVIVLTVVLGWKIVNLDQEKAMVEKEKSILDRDKKSYSMLLKELPT